MTKMTKLFLRRGLLMIAAVVFVFGISLLLIGGAPQGTSQNLTVTVNVSVAVDPAEPPAELRYQWRATDGQIINQSTRTPSTEWTLPAGKGIHFAYVLVSNGKGGYTERRIAVNTDDVGVPSVVPLPVFLSVPPAPMSSAVPFRDWLGGGISMYQLPGGVEQPFKVALPEVGVRARSLDIGEHTSTSFMGDYTLQLFSPQPEPIPLDVFFLLAECSIGDVVNTHCFGLDAALEPDVFLNDLQKDEIIDVEANQTNRVNLVPTPGLFNPQIIQWVTGRVQLEDTSPCGTENEFFGVHVSATVELQNLDGGTIRQVHANSWGQFSIPQTVSEHANVVVRCEGAAPASPTQIGTAIPAVPPENTPSSDVGIVTISGVRAPVVLSMSVTSAPGMTLPPGLIAKFDTPPTGLPSDVVPLRPPKFLAMKGLDTRRSACQYYKAVGAVRDCDPEGNFKKEDAISFDDWERTVKIDEYALPGTPQPTALFVNLVDLNLTREHHSVSYGPRATAGYVCNHLGPKGGVFPTPSDIDLAIDRAADGRDLVACVAMDYSTAWGHEPFTRFLIFGPSGDLLPSVNLDGLGEKFVPGTCVVCHGGNKYAGKFPEDGTGNPDIEAHFLPFDMGSFGFSSKPGFTQPEQEKAIYQLNQNVLKTKPNQAEMDLINAWYLEGQVQNENGVPSALGIPMPYQPFYKNVIAKSCRTCHIAQRDQFSIKDLNFSKFRVNQGKLGELDSSILAEQVCGQTNAAGIGDLVRAYAMPNSLTTFNRFWLSPADPVTGLTQPQELAKRLPGPTNTCTNPKVK